MIRIEGVTHRYGDRVVLRDIDLTLTEARIALIGANGSGKSYAIDILMEGFARGGRRVSHVDPKG